MAKTTDEEFAKIRQGLDGGYDRAAQIITVVRTFGLHCCPAHFIVSTGALFISTCEVTGMQPEAMLKMLLLDKDKKLRSYLDEEGDGYRATGFGDIHG